MGLCGGASFFFSISFFNLIMKRSLLAHEALTAALYTRYHCTFIYGMLPQIYSILASMDDNDYGKRRVTWRISAPSLGCLSKKKMG